MWVLRDFVIYHDKKADISTHGLIHISVGHHYCLCAVSYSGIYLSSRIKLAYV